MISFFLLAFCTFSPPDHWEITQNKAPSPHVEIGFSTKGSNEFCPSINLATEEVSVSLKEYLKAVKEIHLVDKTATWRDLGPFSMKGGLGRLTELTSESSFGTLKILQTFLLKNKTVYILTAAVTKTDLPNFQNQILKSFQSLEIIDDLWEKIEDLAGKESFQNFFTSLGQEDQAQEWQQLQRRIAEHKELGKHWQFLALKEGHAKIYKKSDYE